MEDMSLNSYFSILNSDAYKHSLSLNFDSEKLNFFFIVILFSYLSFKINFDTLIPEIMSEISVFEEASNNHLNNLLSFYTALSIVGVHLFKNIIIFIV